MPSKKNKAAKAGAAVFNRKARFSYELGEKFEAGLVLKGSEVKPLRAGQCQLKDSYIAFRGGEAFLQKAHISPYGPAAGGGHKPERLRKLLLRRRELERLQGLAQQKSMSCVPLRIYFKGGLAKLEIALARGKTKGDKRESLKRRAAERQIERALRKTRR